MMLHQIPCDFCKASPAPLGFAPPPRLGIVVRRPIKTCGAPACNDLARGKVQALIARQDPLAATRPPAEDPAQPALL